MIDISELVRRAQLANLRARINENDAALDLARGLWTPTDGELLPVPTNEARKRAWHRALRQMQSLGTRVMETKLGAVIGEVTWGGKSDKVDDDLKALDLRRLAANLLTTYITTGFMGGYVYTDERGNPRVTRMGGYVEPYTDDADVDRVLGLFQAWQVAKHDDRGTVGRWTVRVYDWSERDDGLCEVREWRNLNEPWELAKEPADEGTMQVPRFVIRNPAQDGSPVGEIMAAMPQFRALWATEARLAMSEELAAFPMMKALGDVDTDDFTVGASEIVTGANDAQVDWMQPGNLDELRQQRLLRIERLTADLALPISFSTTQAVSAESARERNIAFRQNSEGYALDLTQLLTQLVGEDYLTARGAGKPVEIPVTPTLAYDEATRLASVSALFRDGLIPLRVAATAIQPFFPSWSDDDLEAWLTEQESTVSVSDFLAPESGEGDSAPPLDQDTGGIKERADALGVLIRAGVDPQAAARMVGMPGVRFTGAVPVSLRLPEERAEDLEES